MRRMFATLVYERYERGGAALRTIRPTLERAKRAVEAEPGGPSPDAWVDEFDGAIAYVGNLSYEIVPVQVQVDAV